MTFIELDLEEPGYPNVKSGKVYFENIMNPTGEPVCINAPEDLDSSKYGFLTPRCSETPI